MKTAARETSVNHYHATDFTGQRGRVLEALKVAGSSCIADLAAILGWERSTVSARLHELKESGSIVLVGKRPSQRTGVTSEFWKLNNGQLF